MGLPTHHVTHRRNGWSVNIYIADSLQQKLQSLDALERGNAKKAVAMAFRKACESKYANFNMTYVEFGSLEIEPLRTNDPDPAGGQVWTGERWRMPTVTGDIEAECCDNDNCVVCDLGHHERCRNGCTIGH